jgi:hypothetical protein
VERQDNRAEVHHLFAWYARSLQSQPSASALEVDLAEAEWTEVFHVGFRVACNAIVFGAPQRWIVGIKDARLESAGAEAEVDR